MPRVARPALKPDLREGESTGRRRVDDDARQDEGIPFLVEMYGHVHQGLARDVLAGLLQRVDHRVRGRHSRSEVPVPQVPRGDAGSVFPEDRLEEFDALVVTPQW